MEIGFTAKVNTRAHKMLGDASKSVKAEMLELLRIHNESMPDYLLVFCPVAMPPDQLHFWKERIRRSNGGKTFEIEKWIPLGELLGSADEARASYVRWVKASLKEAETQYQELRPARLLFDKLME